MRRADFAKQNVLVSFRFCKPPFNNQTTRPCDLVEWMKVVSRMSISPSFQHFSSGLLEKKQPLQECLVQPIIATLLVRILKRYNLYQKSGFIELSTLLILWRKWSGVSKTYSEQVLYLPFCRGRQGLPLCVFYAFPPATTCLQFQDAMVFHTYQKSQLGQFFALQKKDTSGLEHPKVTLW